MHCDDLFVCTQGMFQGEMISEKGGSSQRQLQNGLQLTGDFCIQHTRVPGSGNGTYKLPFSRTRCMMDQFTQGSIRVNVLQWYGDLASA